MNQPAPAAVRVSVIMNCRNSARFLQPTLESLLAQTLTDYEVIFWDNGSTDESASLVDALDDARFRYFYSAEPAPLGESRNRACREAKGEWLAFLDCDDLWEPDKLARQVEAGNSPEVGLVYGYTEPLVDSAAGTSAMAVEARRLGVLHTGCAIGALPSGHIFGLLLQNNFVPLCSLMIRRSLFEQIGGFRGNLRQAEDYDVILKVARVAEARVVQSRCSRYRIHAFNASHNAALLSIRETIEVLQTYASLPGPDGGLVRRALLRHRTRLVMHLLKQRQLREATRSFTLHMLPEMVRLTALYLWRRVA